MSVKVRPTTSLMIGYLFFNDLLPESLFAQLQDRDSDWAFAQEVLEQHELIIDSSE